MRISTSVPTLTFLSLLVSWPVAADLRVRESFDYPAGTYASVPSTSLEPPYRSPPGAFKDLSGGTGWSRNWDAHVTSCSLVIEEGPNGGWMAGPSDKNTYWRSRNMVPIGSTTDGALVAWNSMILCVSPGGHGGIRVTDPNGGTSYSNPHGFRIDEILLGETFRDVTANIPPVPPYHPNALSGKGTDSPQRK